MFFVKDRGGRSRHSTTVIGWTEGHAIDTAPGACFIPKVISLDQVEVSQSCMHSVCMVNSKTSLYLYSVSSFLWLFLQLLVLFLGCKPDPWLADGRGQHRQAHYDEHGRETGELLQCFVWDAKKKQFLELQYIHLGTRTNDTAGISYPLFSVEMLSVCPYVCPSLYLSTANPCLVQNSVTVWSTTILFILYMSNPRSRQSTDHVFVLFTVDLSSDLKLQTHLSRPNHSIFPCSLWKKTIYLTAFCLGSYFSGIVLALPLSHVPVASLTKSPVGNSVSVFFPFTSFSCIVEGASVAQW